jgi:hypothetical protein
MILNGPRTPKPSPEHPASDCLADKPWLKVPLADLL